MQQQQQPTTSKSSDRNRNASILTNEHWENQGVKIAKQGLRNPTSSIGPVAEGLGLEKEVLRAEVVELRKLNATPGEVAKRPDDIHATETFHIMKHKLGWHNTRCIAAIAQLDPYFGESPERHSILDKQRRDREMAKRAAHAPVAPPVSLRNSAESQEDSQSAGSKNTSRKRNRVDPDLMVVEVAESANSNVPAVPATPPTPLLVPLGLTREQQLIGLLSDVASTTRGLSDRLDAFVKFQ